MTDQAAPASPRIEGFVDNPTAPDVFADEAAGFFFRNGVVSITFISDRPNHEITPGPVSRVVIGRLVMPISGAQNLAEGLFNFLIKQGIAPKITPQNSN